jgi:hypothetical protein
MEGEGQPFPPQQTLTKFQTLISWRALCIHTHIAQCREQGRDSNLLPCRSQAGRHACWLCPTPRHTSAENPATELFFELSFVESEWVVVPRIELRFFESEVGMGTKWRQDVDMRILCNLVVPITPTISTWWSWDASRDTAVRCGAGHDCGAGLLQSSVRGSSAEEMAVKVVFLKPWQVAADTTYYH